MANIRYPDRQEIDTLVGAFQRGDLDTALRCARALTERYPGHGFGWNALGGALGQLGRLDEALAALETSVRLAPGDAEAHSNLGSALHKLNRPADAEASFRRAVQIAPHFAQAHNFLGAALHDLARFDEAQQCFRRALELAPGYAQAYYNLGAAQHAVGALVDAALSFERALERAPAYAEALAYLGNTLLEMGHAGKAQDCYRRALRLQPGITRVHSDLIFSLNYTDPDGHRVLDEARRYAIQVASTVPAPFTRWNHARDARRLRVGLVSGDLCRHPVAYFLEALVTRLDPARVELFAYPTRWKTDDLTARLARSFASWKPLAGMDDEAAARTIHGDGLHVLIDLSGHTGHNRLPVFARKPAPVQATWLGYFATTGVPAIDFVIADRWCLQDGQERYFTERICRLPHTRLCFTAPDHDVEVSALPASRNGFVTLGCFNNLAKMGEPVVAAWSRILHAVPASRLFLKARPLAEPGIRSDVIARFAAAGVGRDRLILEGPVDRDELLRAYRRVDIALDPFPFTGGTTTVEALWMGVPVLTLAGRQLVSRQGVSLLANAGLPGWIADDVEDYVRRAVAAARDLPALETLRRDLRAQVLASPLFDAPRFARDFEEALRWMWSRTRGGAAPSA
jgi:predicted O-linked N-acetylglucosamine transferase (SPINDLY family)